MFQTGLPSMTVTITGTAPFLSMLTAGLLVVAINLFLSADNAAVIALAIRDLPGNVRRRAALIGSVGAVVVRIVLTAFATFLTETPFVNAAGGLLLVWITVKLVTQTQTEQKVRTSTQFWSAVQVIILADLSMAFDNVVGVAGAARGNVPLVVFALVVSIPVVVLGSNSLTLVMRRWPFIVYVGVAVLVHTATSMIVHDKGLNLCAVVGYTIAATLPVLLSLFVLVVGCAYSLRARSRQFGSER